MDENQDEAFNKEAFLEESKTISQKILEKHLVGRKFDENKVKKWGDLIINEIHKTLSDKYPQYGFCIFFYMSDKTAFLSNYGSIYYADTDIRVFAHYYTDDFYSEIRMLATKIILPSDGFFNFVKNKKLSSEIKQKISYHLDSRTYNHEIFDKVIDNIYQDINKILLSKDNKPVSFQNVYINKLPTDGIYFYYKFFNLELHPLFFKYHNDSFICRVYLFLINN